ncbi:MAG TPA: hypothetical protein VGU66_12745 [Candidatus Elarobacter sp.]|nr:hypothetical protein [Candidatus Elarobacter sp.]
MNLGDIFREKRAREAEEAERARQAELMRREGAQKAAQERREYRKRVGDRLITVLRSSSDPALSKAKYGTPKCSGPEILEIVCRGEVSVTLECQFEACLSRKCRVRDLGFEGTSWECCAFGSCPYSYTALPIIITVKAGYRRKATGTFPEGRTFTDWTRLDPLVLLRDPSQLEQAIFELASRM